MTIPTRFSMSLLILALLGFSAFGSTASAAPPVARDGKIYACYKAKGKGKGTMRLVRNGKVRCQRKWKKVAWYANGSAGPVLVAPVGPAGPKGDTGSQGVPGTAGNVVVEQLEDKVSELLTKVESLEGALANLAFLEATVTSLCGQTETLTGQLNALESVVGGISLKTILAVLLEIPALPGALPSFNCPTN